MTDAPDQGGQHQQPGEQPDRFGGARTYVMPNPSGANAHASRAEIVAHLSAVRELATD